MRENEITLVRENEITLELLAKTTLEFMRLEKYKDVPQYELIEMAYDFLDECDEFLKDEKGRGIYTPWVEAVQEITGNKKGSKRLADFFIEKAHWWRKMASDTDGESRWVEEAHLRSSEQLKHLHVKTFYIPEIKLNFELWNARKNSERGRKNRDAKKKFKIVA